MIKKQILLAHIIQIVPRKHILNLRVEIILIISLGSNKMKNIFKIFKSKYTKDLNKKEQYLCPVCGYPELLEKPFDINGGGSYEICPSCGFEFGYDDCNHIDYSKETYLFVREQCIKAWRKKWIENGMQWSSKTKKPINWNPSEQLNNLKL